MTCEERRYLFLGSRLKRLGERMQADATLLAPRAGLPSQPGHYPVLASIESGPRTIGDIARSLGLSQPAVTQTVRRLSGDGLVVVERTGRDRRERRVAISERGNALLDTSRRQVWPFLEAAVRAVIDDLSGPLLDQLDTVEARLAERPLHERAAAAAEAGHLAVLLERATAADLPVVVALMNRAYREPAGSWTNEAAYIDGDRASVELLRAEMAASPDGRLLVWRRGGGEPGLRGCVWLEPHGEETWYLGSLTIDPAEQNAGLGRRLLAAAEAWIAGRGGRTVRMSVVNVRETLIAWYFRRGYALTGESSPFPYDDARFGTPRRADLAFVVLSKRLA
jgi:DNA-binding MarR family transcriptional regulator